MPYLYITIYRNFIVRDKNLDTIKCSLKGECTKIVVYLSSEVVLSNKREQLLINTSVHKSVKNMLSGRSFTQKRTNFMFTL